MENYKYGYKLMIKQGLTVDYSKYEYSTPTEAFEAANNKIKETEKYLVDDLIIKIEGVDTTVCKDLYWLKSLIN